VNKLLEPPEPAERQPSWNAGPRTDRARERLLAAAERVFLERGYAGTTVSHIVTAAGVSRASFYVYFPSKRDVFLALGVDSLEASTAWRRALRAVPSHWTDRDLAKWLEAWFDHFEQYGAFERLWRQQAPDELKALGIAAEERSAAVLGNELARLRGRDDGDAVLRGIGFTSLVEGLWYFHRRANVDRGRTVAALVDAARLFLSRT
jgi:TetR/AcrR family transcriptional regulator, ethionamide resistance regulator